MEKKNGARTRTCHFGLAESSSMRRLCGNGCRCVCSVCVGSLCGHALGGRALTLFCGVVTQEQLRSFDSPPANPMHDGWVDAVMQNITRELGRDRVAENLPPMLTDAMLSEMKKIWGGRSRKSGLGQCTSRTLRATRT